MSSDTPPQDFYQGTGSKDSGVGPIYTRNHASGEARVQYGNNYTTQNIIQKAPQQGADSSATEQTPVKKFMELLEFKEMNYRYDDIRAQHDETCEWLLNMWEWQAWQNPGNISWHQGLFCIKGKAGSGKSTMMKFAIRTMEEKRPDETVLHYFFNARAGEVLQNSVAGLYRVLLHQALQKLPHLEDVFEPQLLSRPNVRTSYDLKLGALQDLFRLAIKNLRTKPLTCFIDGLDECKEKDIQDLLRFFESLARSATKLGDQFRVCLSSRHYPNVTLRKSIDLTLEDQKEHNNDIEEYVDSELRIGGSKQAIEIKAELIRRASGIFLWVELATSILSEDHGNGCGFYELKKRLEEIPDSLEDFFEIILCDTTHRAGNTISILQWLLFTQRSLTCEELYFAVRSGELDTTSIYWDRNDMNLRSMEKFILASSKGLAEVTAMGIVQFIHETVRTFLSGSKGLRKLDQSLLYSLEAFSNDHLRHCCEKYISLFAAAEPEYLASNRRVPPNKLSVHYPLIQYATERMLFHANTAHRGGVRGKVFADWLALENWVDLHQLLRYNFSYRRTNEILPDAIDWLAFELEYEAFDPSTKSTDLRAWFGVGNPFPVGGDRPYSFEVTKIYLFARLCYESLLEFELDQIHDFNAECKESCASALSVAVDMGNDLSVELLLNKGVEPMPRLLGTSDLCQAASNGYEQVVRLLYGRCANMKSITTHYVTLGKALLSACEGGHMNIVRFLTDQGADIEADGSELINRAHIIAYGGCRRDIAEHLFGFGASLSKGLVDTPLTMAIGGCRIDIAEHLLKCGASLSHLPLHAAAVQGQEEMATLLIHYGADINEDHYILGTAPHMASAQCDLEMVELLLRNGAKAYLENHIFGTPLHVACAKGILEIVELLLDAGASPDPLHEALGTPLHLAACFDYLDVATLLLQRGANVNAVGGAFGSALRAASLTGNEDLVKLLLLEGSANVHLVAPSRVKPSYAKPSHAEFSRNNASSCPKWVEGVHLGYFRELRPDIEREFDLWMRSEHKVIESYSDEAQSTAVEAARSQGHNEIVKMLLEWSETGRVGAEPQDAAEHENQEVISNVRSLFAL